MLALEGRLGSTVGRPRDLRGSLGVGLVILITMVACAPEVPRGVEAPVLPSAAAARTLPGPDFELLGLDGELRRLSSYRGRVLLVNFWATWCLSCRDELPVLERLHRELEDRGVSIVGIATDREGRAKVEPYVKEMDLTYPILLDPEEVSASLFGGLAGYPSTFILDAQGLIYSTYLGAQEEETFAEDLRYLLEAEPSDAAPMPEGAITDPAHVSAEDSPPSGDDQATPPPQASTS